MGLKLAAVTLKQIHGIYGYCVASNVVFFHGGLLTFSAFNAGAPLCTPNDSHVITPYPLVPACRNLAEITSETSTKGSTQIVLSCVVQVNVGEVMQSLKAHQANGDA